MLATPIECGTGVLDVVKIDVQEAKTAAAAAKKCPEDVDALWYAALLCSALETRIVPQPAALLADELSVGAVF